MKCNGSQQLRWKEQRSKWICVLCSVGMGQSANGRHLKRGLMSTQNPSDRNLPLYVRPCQLRGGYWSHSIKNLIKWRKRLPLKSVHHLIGTSRHLNTENAQIATKYLHVYTWTGNHVLDTKISSTLIRHEKGKWMKSMGYCDQLWRGGQLHKQWRPPTTF